MQGALRPYAVESKVSPSRRLTGIDASELVDCNRRKRVVAMNENGERSGQGAGIERGVRDPKLERIGADRWAVLGELGGGELGAQPREYGFASRQRGGRESRPREVEPDANVWMRRGKQRHQRFQYVAHVVVTDHG